MRVTGKESMSPLDTIAIPLVRAVMCATCDAVSNATGEVCPSCGSKGLLSLARVLQQTKPVQRKLF